MAINKDEVDLHLVGIVSMMIGIKIEWRHTIDINTWVESVGHNYFDYDELFDMEEKILNALNFELNQ